MTRSADILDKIVAAGEMSLRDLLKFDPADVAPLFENALIERFDTKLGTAVRPTVAGRFKPEKKVEIDPLVHTGLTLDQQIYLQKAYPAGVSFLEMLFQLKISATKLLRAAWKLKLERPHARAPIPKRAHLADGRRFGAEIPAWRFRRLRFFLMECEERGQDRRDKALDLAHRAAVRRFEKGRATPRAFHGAYSHLTGEEETILLDLHQQGLGNLDIAIFLKRRADGIGDALRKRGLVPNNRYWTSEEDSRIVAGISNGMTAREIASNLLGRSRVAVKIRAGILWPGRGAKLWTEEESAELEKAFARGELIRDIAVRLRKTVGSCRWRARYLGLEHPASTMNKQFTAEEHDIIRKGYKDGLPVRKIAEKLPDRSSRSIYTYAFKAGFRHKHSRPWTAGDVEALYQLVQSGLPARKIAERMDRTKHAVYLRAKRYGFRFDKKLKKAIRRSDGKFAGSARCPAHELRDDARPSRPLEPSFDEGETGMECRRRRGNREVSRRYGEASQDLA